MKKWSRFIEKNRKKLILFCGAISIALIAGLVLANTEKLEATFNPSSYQSDEKRNDNRIDYDSTVFGSQEGNDDGMELDEESKEDYELEENQEQSILDQQNKNQGLTFSDENGAEGGNSGNALSAGSGEDGPVIAGNGGNNGASGGTTPGSGTNGTGEGQGSGGNTGEDDEPETPKDPNADKYGTDYNAPESVETFTPGKGVNVKEIKVSKGSLMQHFFEGEAPRIEEMRSYLTVRAVLSDGTTRTLNYRPNAETGGDYTVSWGNNPGNTETNAIGYPTVGTQVGTYTATISYKGHKAKVSYDIVHWQVTLNDFEGENEPEDIYTTEYAVFPRAISPVENPVINLADQSEGEVNAMQTMYNLIGARTQSVEEESGYTYQHINKRKEDDGSEWAQFYYVEFFGGWTDSVDTKSTGNTYQMKRPTDEQIEDGVYNVELIPTWNTLDNQGDYTVALDGSDGEGEWTTKLIMYTGEGPVLEIPEGVTRFSAIDYSSFMFPLYEDENITKIVIPASLDRYENEEYAWAFSNLFPNLEEIEVAEGNQTFLSIDGILYNKTGKKLLSVPPAKTSINEWSSKVEEIAPNAFQYTAMEAVSVPKSVYKCDADSFFNAKIGHLILKCEDKLYLGEAAFNGTDVDDEWNTISAIRKLTIRADELAWLDEWPAELFPDLNPEFDSRNPIVQDSGIKIIVKDSEDDKVYLSAMRMLRQGIDEYNGDMDSTYAVLTTPKHAEKHYRYENGILVTEDGEELYLASKLLTGDVQIPDGVKTIKENSFDGCQNIGAIFLPAGLEQIEGCAFSDMYGLSSLYCWGTTAPAFSHQIFGESFTDGLKIYVSDVIYDTCIRMGRSVFDKDYGDGKSEEVFVSIENLDQMINDDSNLYFANDDGTYSLYKAKESAQGIFTPMENTTAFLDGCFQNCGSLSGIVLPDTLQTMGQQLFDGCTSLQVMAVNSERIPETQTDTFSDEMVSQMELFISTQTNLEDSDDVWNRFGERQAIETTYAGANQAGGNSALYGERAEGANLVYAVVTNSAAFELRDDTVEIYQDAFKGRTLLTAVSNGGSVKKIGANAFENCTSLLGVDVKNVESLGSAAFKNCARFSNLQAANSASIRTGTILPAGLTSLPDECFAGCVRIRQVTLSENLTALGVGTFRDCTALSHILTNGYNYYTLPPGVTEVPDYCFSGCGGLGNMWLQSELVRVGAHAFENCQTFTFIPLPQGLQTIDEYAFYGCTSLRTGDPDLGEYLPVPETVTELGANCFGACTSLTAVKVESTLLTLGDSAFAGDSSLTELSFAVIPQNIADPDEITSITEKFFAGCPLASLKMGETELIPQNPAEQAETE